VRSVSIAAEAQLNTARKVREFVSVGMDVLWLGTWQCVSGWVSGRVDGRVEGQVRGWWHWWWRCNKSTQEFAKQNTKNKHK
jgi:hypothetical protein